MKSRKGAINSANTNKVSSEVEAEPTDHRQLAGVWRRVAVRLLSQLVLAPLRCDLDRHDTSL